MSRSAFHRRRSAARPASLTVALVVLALAAFGLFALLQSQNQSSSASVRGTTPSAKRIAALIARRTINGPGNRVGAASCRSAGYAGYRCAVMTDGGPFVCDANGAVDPPTPPTARRLTVLACDSQAHYDASVNLTRSLARSSLDAINANPQDAALLRRFAARSTSIYCRIHRLRVQGAMTRAIAVDLTTFARGHVTHSIVWEVVPARNVTVDPQAWRNWPIAAWSSCALSADRVLVGARTGIDVWPVEYANEDRSASA